jgi:membrane dipeptidase
VGLESTVTCCTLDRPSRRAWLRGLFGVVAAACAGPGADASARRQRDVVRQGAAALAGAPVVDLHSHPGAFTRRSTGGVPTEAIAEMRAAGVSCAFFAAVGDGPVIRRDGTGSIRNYRDPEPGELDRSTRGQLERVLVQAREGNLPVILGAADLSRLTHERGPAALLAIEGGDPLEGDAGRVREFHALGVRSIQLVHYRVNELGDIQTEPARHGGLTLAGADVVAEMNRLGMVVDAAHAAPDALRAILAASRTPVVVSHTGPAALRSYARHLPDDLLRAVAGRGGVIGVWPLVRQRPASLAQFLADLHHVRRIAGIEHTALATDMTGLSTFTAILSYEEFSAVPAALLASGFSEDDCRRLLGGNVLRLVESVLDRA